MYKVGTPLILEYDLYSSADGKISNPKGTVCVIEEFITFKEDGDEVYGFRAMPEDIQFKGKPITPMIPNFTNYQLFAFSIKAFRPLTKQERFLFKMNPEILTSDV